MIKINVNLKNGDTISHLNMPHLFAVDDNTYRVRDFYCDFDKDNNLIVETVIFDKEQLKAKIMAFLHKHIDFCNKIIHQTQEKRFAIKEMLNEYNTQDIRYCVVADLQGTDFGFGRDYTLDQWRIQAYEWCYMDDNYDLMLDVKNCPDNKLLQFIGVVWGLEFKKVRKDKKHLESADEYAGETPETYFNKVYIDETEENKNEK